MRVGPGVADLLLGRMTAYAQRLDEGHGLAWLPRSLVADEIAAGALVCIAPEIAMEVRLYRKGRRRAVVESVWAAADDVFVAPS